MLTIQIIDLCFLVYLPMNSIAFLQLIFKWKKLNKPVNFNSLVKLINNSAVMIAEIPLNKELTNM